MENSKDKKIAKSDHSSDNHIGSDEFMEILTWMPAKLVIKFSSLSKTIYSLTSMPSFVKTQCIRSSTIASCPRGVILQDLNHRSGKHAFHSLPEEDAGIPDESLSYIYRTGYRIMASSQGLLLLKKNKKELWICNPTTSRCAPLAILPGLESGRCKYSFARAHLECHTRNLNSNWAADYTVIILVLKDANCCELLVNHNGKWEEGMCDLSSLRPLHPSKPVCLFNGWNGGLVIHYFCGNGAWSVVAYDVDRKAYSRSFNLPEECAPSSLCDCYVMRLFKWRWSSSRCETIAVVRSQYTPGDSYSFTVWVLEDYEGGSWTRVFEKTIAEMGLMGSRSVGSYILVMNVMGMGLVFATRDRVYAYQLDGPHSGRLQVVAEHGYAAANMELVHYTNTLSPVCAGETQLVTF